MKNMSGKSKKGKRILAAVMVLMMTVMTFAPLQMGLNVAYGEETQTESKIGTSSSQQNVQSEDNQISSQDSDNNSLEDSTKNDADVSDDQNGKAVVKKENDTESNKEQADKADKKDETAKAEKKDAEEQAKGDDELSFKGKDFNTVVSYGDKAELPEGTKLKVNDVDKKDNRYDELYKNAVKAVQPSGKKDVKTLSFVKFYDIDLMNDGKEIEPSASVDVNFDFAASLSKDLKAENKNNVHIIHLKEIGRTGTYKTEVLGKEDVDPTIEGSRLTETSFKADSFSVYAVVYTVDFHYGDYDYSIKGESDIMLSELFEKLKIDIPAADVEKAEFSDPSLVKVEKVKGSDSSKDDWKISSLKPFASKEKLTIETLYGTFTIDVTDAQYQYNYRIVASNGTLRGETNDLQTAYNNASSGDTIQVCKDNAITARVNINTNNKNVTLTSADPEHPCTISRTSYNGRMFHITSGALAVKNVIIDGNKYEYSSSGAIFGLFGGDLTLGQGAVLQNGINSGSGYGDGGGGAVCVEGGLLTMDKGSIIRKCKAVNTGVEGGKGGGVYVHTSDAKFTMKEGSLIEDCEAYRSTFYAGGGVCVMDSENFVMEGGTIKNCKAAATNNKGSSGGGIGVDHYDTIIIKGGLITGCSATNRGGAIEAHGTVDMRGGTITDCHSANGGAINFYTNGENPANANNGDEAIIIFSGSPKIYDNYNDSNPDQPCNVDIYHHYLGDQITRANIRIRTTTPKLNGEAVIGVYSGEYEDHGKFGIYKKGATLTHLNCFVNDRDSSLVGTDGGDDTYNNNGVLVWAKGVKAVARIYTDDPSDYIELKGSAGRYSFTYPSSGIIDESIGEFAEEYKNYKQYEPMIDKDVQLSFARVGVKQTSGGYQEKSTDLSSIRTKVTVTGTGSKKSYMYEYWYRVKNDSNNYEMKTEDEIILYYKVDPVVKATDTNGNLLFFENENPAIFAKLNTPFSKIGTYYSYDSNDNLIKYNNEDNYFKMLVDDYIQSEGVDAESDMSNTTANPNKVNYPKYRVALTTDVPSGQFSRVTSADKKCVVSRGDYFTNGNLIKSKLNQLKLEKIVLDGKNISSSGGAVSVKNGKLEVTNAEIKNSITSANGGAINASKSTVSVKNGTKITNCKSSNENGGGGGAVYANNSSVTLTDSTIDNCITSSSNSHGGAICFVADSKAGNLTVNGSSQITNCASQQTGGAIAVFNNSDNGSTITITDNAKLTGNNAVQGGGALHVRNNSPVINITGNVEFKDNKATGISNSDYDMSYGSGGAMHFQNLGSNSKININGSSIKFSNNTAENSGGAIFMQSTAGTSLKGKVAFDSNKAKNGNGGAIAVGDGQTNVDVDGDIDIAGTTKGDISFTKNIASGTAGQGVDKGCGGAIYAKPKLSISGAVFGGKDNGNTATGSGGAVWNGYSDNNGSVIKNSSISYNRAGANGGGVHYNEYLKINSCNIEHNTAKNGGAVSIFGWNNGNVINNSVIKNNSAIEGGSGGGIYLPYGDFTLRGTTTITNNTASGKGGGLYVDKGFVKVQDTLKITDNTSSLGSDNLHEMKENNQYAIIMTGDLTNSAIGVYSEKKHKPDAYNSYQFGYSDKNGSVYNGVYMFMNDYYQELRGVSKSGSNGLFWPEESALRIKKVVTIGEGQSGPKDGEDTEYTFKLNISGEDFQGNKVAYTPGESKNINVPSPYTQGQNVDLTANWSQVSYRVFNADHTPVDGNEIMLNNPESELKLKNGQYAVVSGIYTGTAAFEAGHSIGYLRYVTVDVDETDKKKANDVNVTPAVGALVGHSPEATFDGSKSKVVFDYTGMNIPAEQQNNNHSYTSGSNADLTYNNIFTEDPTVPLTITKTVEGNYARFDQPFTFHISIDGKTGADTLACVKMTSGGTELTGSEQQKSVKAELGEFQLTHGQKIVIQVPENAKVTVTEEEQPGYTAAFELGDGTQDLNAAVDNGKKFKIGEAAATVDVTNTFDDDSVIPTGLSAGIYKLLILIGLILTCAALILREFLINTRTAKA